MFFAHVSGGSIIDNVFAIILPKVGNCNYFHDVLIEYLERALGSSTQVYHPIFIAILRYKPKLKQFKSSQVKSSCL